MQKVLSCLSLFALLGCGPRPMTSSPSHSQIPADWADNTPIKSHCFALGQSLAAAVPVDFDDQAEVRVCASIQKDARLGVDLRLRPNQPHSGHLAALVVVRNTQGEEARRMFRLDQDPLSADYTLYLSQGCLVGRPGGCARTSSPAMRELLAPIASQEGGIGFKPFVFEVSFIDLAHVKLEAIDTELVNRQPAYKVLIPAL